ncbi:hypothetical protein PILCRDRAFT_85748 [Piloderma croceum F 1598]|uniref:Aminoglycoside phosphotransferase domain-containing protein n=1 Tax=Piloderma croceum (strain F 1598) TaxID=765440 RepID=A0A0C3BND4_PILCF|nr:hypothetical protein PILCRDRAFT_85748 [Piloderma croceum F 1598]
MHQYDEQAASGASSNDSYDSDELPPLEPNVDELLSLVSHQVGRQLLFIRRLTRGRYHEVHALFSPDRQWSCIARLSRSIESTAKLSSELATMKYVRAQTRIPVPEVYCYDFSPTNSVGMQFIAMEHIPGRHLYQIWDDLTMDHKKATLSQIAAVLGQLAQLKFPQEDFKLGSLLRMKNQVDDPKNGVTVASGPFTSTFDYFASVIEGEIIHHRSSEGEDVDSLLFDVKSILQAYNLQHASSSSIRPPFRLLHADFDDQNVLFTDPKYTNGAPPRLTGVIDWEYAHTAPVYFLYEYPIFIQDNDNEQNAYVTNAILRPHFVQELCTQFPRDSEAYMEVRECMSAKCSTLNTFRDIFMLCGMEWKMLKSCVLEYIREEKDGTGEAYRSRFDWVPDHEIEGDE